MSIRTPAIYFIDTNNFILRFLLEDTVPKLVKLNYRSVEYNRWPRNRLTQVCSTEF